MTYMKSCHHCRLQNHWANERHVKHERPREMDYLSIGIFKTTSLLQRLQAFWVQGLTSGMFFQSSFPSLSPPSSLFSQTFTRAMYMGSSHYSHILPLKSSPTLYCFQLRLLLWLKHYLACFERHLIILCPTAPREELPSHCISQKRSDMSDFSFVSLPRSFTRMSLLLPMYWSEHLNLKMPCPH